MHDIEFDIATGSGRNAATWQNKRIWWSQLVEQLRTTTRTRETVAAYMAMPPDRQDEIKDVGGFVGGHLVGGKRRNGAVLHRQLLTLDLDFAKPDFWGVFTLFYDCAAVVYSTHKYTPEKPRLRLLIPLAREVNKEEYVAIGRRIAGNLGIDQFDDTGYQPARLMYWPSTSADGVYLFETQAGKPLDPDAVLATYRDWRDTSSWPISSRHNARMRKAADKAGDPLEKGGIVGAFCRTYDIEAAIGAYLPNVYTPSDLADRYTYAEGTTSAGLVLYEHKFAYSHHMSDPAGGRLCNAFDLVRLHLYGARDDGFAPDTPIHKLPSYGLMVERAAKDDRVRGVLVDERTADALRAFEAVQVTEDAPTTPDDPDWQKKLQVDKKGGILSTIDNIVIILENDPRLKGCYAYDEFAQRAVALKRLPWRKPGVDGQAGASYIRETDDDNLAHYLERVYGIGDGRMKRALGVMCERHRRHPVRAYLDTLVWDGTPRIDTLLVEYLGAEDTDYQREVMRTVLTAAVTRVYRPGCKFDYVMVLVGEQGDGKSTFVSRLGGPWFSDSLSGVHGKDAYEQLQGVWVMEIAELAALKRGEIEAVKHFVAKPSDRFRVAYGRRTEDFPRQCVFIGTTNEHAFLQDYTGDRRFWPVVTSLARRERNPFTDLTPDLVGQIWAEAKHLYEQNGDLYLSRDQEAEAKARQEQHRFKDARTEPIREYLDTLLPEDWAEMNVWDRRQFLKGQDPTRVGIKPRERVTIPEIWMECLDGQIKDLHAGASRPIHQIMRTLKNWEELGKVKMSGVAVRGYSRIS